MQQLQITEGESKEGDNQILKQVLEKEEKL